jgi:hypothetical protein
MPAPVSSSVFPFCLTPFADVVSLDAKFDCGTDDCDSEGARNSSSAAMAPLVDFALRGMMVGKGSGSVYGTRKRGIAPTSRDSILLSSKLHHARM